MDIKMGNDEFILYIRKNSRAIGKTNDALGREIWKWIQRHIPGAVKLQDKQTCHWGQTGSFINETNLPQTAAQFQFDRSYLPQLYSFLDTL